MRELNTILAFSNPYKQDVEYLEVNKHCPMLIKDLDGQLIKVIRPPETGWDLNVLEQPLIEEDIARMGYDIIFNGEWFGSSEM